MSAAPTLVPRRGSMDAGVKAPRALSGSASFLLDILRLSAAICVVVAHAGHPEFSTGFQNRQVLGDGAVPVFFVLSGFVIRFVTTTRERNHPASHPGLRLDCTRLLSTVLCELQHATGLAPPAESDVPQPILEPRHRLLYQQPILVTKL